MMVYKLDINNFYIDFAELTEENKYILNYTTKQMFKRYYKPRFNHNIQDWEEGATLEEIEEIKRQEEANRPPQELIEEKASQEYVEELERKLIDLEIRMYEYL